MKFDVLKTIFKRDEDNDACEGYSLIDGFRADFNGEPVHYISMTDHGAVLENSDLEVSTRIEFSQIDDIKAFKLEALN